MIYFFLWIAKVFSAPGRTGGIYSQDHPKNGWHEDALKGREKASA